MLVRLWCGILIFGAMMSGFAVEPDPASQELPEVVATVDGHPIYREAVIARLRDAETLSPGTTSEERKTAMRRAAEQEIYFFLLGRLLASEKIVPSEAAAARHLAELKRLLPRGLPETRAGLMRLAASENYRWNVALQEYLERVAPDVIAVSDVEVEQCYRLNQNKFRLPVQYRFGVIRILKSVPGAKEKAEAARSRLRQGELFDRVAAEVDPEGSVLSESNLLELLRKKGATLSEGKISRVLDDSDAYYLVQVKSKTPERFIPFKEIAPYLRLQLISEKTAAALETILRGELKKAQIRFFIGR